MSQAVITVLVAPRKPTMPAGLCRVTLPQQHSMGQSPPCWQLQDGTHTLVLHKGLWKMEISLTSSQMGCCISFSTWQALVVTELTPAHHSTEKSQGWFTTYKLTEILSWRYCLHRESLVSAADSRVPTCSTHSRRGPYVWDAIQHLQPRGRTAWRARPRADLLARQRTAASSIPSPAWWGTCGLGGTSPLPDPGTQLGLCPDLSSQPVALT